MQIIHLPKESEWESLIARPTIGEAFLNDTVDAIFSDVQKKGDSALRKYTKHFDKVNIKSFRVSDQEINDAKKNISNDLKQALSIAKRNITKFHIAQQEKKNKITTSKGVVCWREYRPIETIGIYIPGGTAPLFSTVLMLGIPATIAGCKEIILCTPPNKEGAINPFILYAAELVGINNIFKIGGIQAIAAMTFGTATIPKVDKIFGPGNQYVTAAKQTAQRYDVAIDMPAGPSEVLIIVDKECVPEFVAADLLSQAEHGVDSQVILLADNDNMVNQIMVQLEIQLNTLPRKKIAKLALQNSRAIILQDIQECIKFSNFYAPEHLILALQNAQKYISYINNAGSVFLGNYSCESAGDYASGTNHTLPTKGYARNYSGVSLDSFVKKITFQEINSEGIQNIGKAIEQMAEAEQLIAHKNAVSIRLKKLKNNI